MATGTEIHSDRRLPAITGLRIAAALIVYVSHMGPPAGAPAFVESFFTSGYCGVTIFFVLSGFVLSFNYFEAMRVPRAGTIYDFFLARFARLYPLYLLVLLYILLRVHVQGASLAGAWEHLLAIQSWSGQIEDAYNFNGPGWSIGVEFFLYACFPLLVPLLGKLRTPRQLLVTAGCVVLAMVALAAWFAATGKADLPWADPSSAHRWLYRTPLTRLGDFALGILAARLFIEVGGRAAVVKAGRWLAPAAALAIVALMAWPALIFTPWSWDLAYALPAALLIFSLAVAPTGWLARGFSLPGVILLGEASYAFYLIHQPGIGLLGAGQWATNFSASVVLLEALNLAAVCALAVGLHLGFELPARRKLRKLLARRRSAPERPVPAPAPTR